MTTVDPALLLLFTLLSVVLVVLLITWLKLPAFIALAAGSLFIGLAARMPLIEIPRAFQQGVGDTLGFISMVIGLGTVIGKLLAESGGAVVVSTSLSNALGERRLDWALLFSGFIIGLPVFFQVGLVLLAPVLFTLTRRLEQQRAHGAGRLSTSAPLLRLGLPLVAGLSAAHGLTPPHPGPLAAIERLGADTGRTLFYSLVVALPVAMVSGPLFVLGWVIAALLRLSVGSATVACVTAASIMAPIVAAAPGVDKDLLVVAIGAGSLIASHVNDGGFWLIKEYYNLTVLQTVATWTVLETIISIAGLATILVVAMMTR